MYFKVVMLFFFKQKTAYEMRISDWSSDVCSSDLNSAARLLALNRCFVTFISGISLEMLQGRADNDSTLFVRGGCVTPPQLWSSFSWLYICIVAFLRSEERSVGKELCQYV